MSTPHYSQISISSVRKTRLSKILLARHNPQRKCNMTSHTKTLKNIESANKSLTYQSIIMEGYANSIEQQPEVDLLHIPTLKNYQDPINRGIRAAKSHANTYMSEIKPKILRNINNIANFYAIHNGVSTSLSNAASKTQWVNSLSILEKTSLSYQKESHIICDLLNHLHNNLINDSSWFSNTVNELNKAFKGEEQELKNLFQDLNNKEEEQYETGKKRDIGTGVLGGGAVVIILSGLLKWKLKVGWIGILGGVLIVGLGAIFAILGESYRKAAEINEKQIENKISLVAPEVKWAAIISSQFTSLGKKMKRAASAAVNMKNVWQDLSYNLGKMTNDIKNDIINNEQARVRFITSTNHVIKNVTTDIDKTKSQLDGMTIIKAKPGQELSDVTQQIIQSTRA